MVGKSTFVGTLLVIGLMLAIFVTVSFAQNTPVTTPIDVPSEWMPGNRIIPGRGCLSLHDGNFRCQIDPDIGIVYDAVAEEITTTSARIHDHTLGDFIILWGTPTGYFVGDYFVEVYWDEPNAAAYLSQCTLRSTTPVTQIVYSNSHVTGLTWRGSIGSASGCQPLPNIG